MFDWFGKTFGRRYSEDNRSDLEKVADDMNKVLKFPELKSVPPMPKVEMPSPEPESAGKTYYRLGLTDNNRVAFSMGYTEITMNRNGVQTMISQLEFYRDQLEVEEEE